MRIAAIFLSIQRMFRFWFYRCTQEFKDYSGKIQILNEHTKQLRIEANTISFKEACLPTVIATNTSDPNNNVRVFSWNSINTKSPTMVEIRRACQGGKSGLYILGDRFDALCNRFEMQIEAHDLKAASTTLKAMEEIEAELRCKDKNRYLIELKNKLI